jgi:hypothetical protein
VNDVVQPLRRALLDNVQAETARMLAQTDVRAAATVAEAERQGRALVDQVRRDADAAAAVAAANEQARARRQARTLVLAARRELYEELVRQARAAAHALRDDPVYAELLERWSAAARAQLGDDAVLEVDPPGVGGVRASSGGRNVDYTLDVLVERCLQRLGGTVERLWSEPAVEDPGSARHAASVVR